MDSSSTISSTNTAASTATSVLTPRWGRPHDENNDDEWSASRRGSGSQASTASSSQSSFLLQPPLSEPPQADHDMDETARISQEQRPTSMQRNIDQKSNTINHNNIYNNIDEGSHLTPLPHIDDTEQPSRQQRRRHNSEFETGSSYKSILNIGIITSESKDGKDDDDDGNDEKDGADEEDMDEINMDAKAKSLPNLNRKQPEYYFSDYKAASTLYCLDDIAMKYRMTKDPYFRVHDDDEAAKTESKCITSNPTLVRNMPPQQQLSAHDTNCSTPQSTNREMSSSERETEVSTGETPAGNARTEVGNNAAPPLTTSHFSNTYHLPPPPPMAATTTMIPHVPGAFRMSLRYLNELDEEVDSTADQSQLPRLQGEQHLASPTQPQRRRVSFADQQEHPQAQQEHSQLMGNSTEPPLLVPHASVVESQDSREQRDDPDQTMLVLGEPQPWYLKRRVYLRVLLGTSALAVVAVITLTIVLVLINVDSKSTAANAPIISAMTVPTQSPTPLARGGILWQEIASVQGVRGGDKLGWSVAAVMDTTNTSNMSDSRGFYWVTGAPFCDAGGGMSNVGCVYAFHVSSERGANTSAIGSSIPQNLPISTVIQADVASSTLGWSVAMASVNGSLIVATGAPQNSIYGYVRVYQYNPANASPWTQMGQDLLGDSLPGNFGTNVALSANGRILAVASDEYSQGSAGHFGGQVQVYCYDCTRSTNIPHWAQMGLSLFGNGTSELFGYSIALSSNGKILAVGSIGYSSTGSAQGIVQVFSYQNNKWQGLGNSLTGQIGQFLLGSSVALSSDGTILAVGAVGGANNAGLVRVYRYEDSTNKWIQMGTDLIGSSQYDFFGTAVSLSANGTVLAATADQHWHTASRKGYARVYKYTNESDWQQLGQDLLGRETGEQMGQSIVLTADGNHVIVGAPYPTSMNESGSVFVFQATPVD